MAPTVLTRPLTTYMGTNIVMEKIVGINVEQGLIKAEGICALNAMLKETYELIYLKLLFQIFIFIVFRKIFLTYKVIGSISLILPNP